MSNHEPKPKRSKFITTWFQKTNVSSSSSNVMSEPSISSPIIDDHVLMKHAGGIKSPHHAAMQKWDLLRNPTKQIETVFQSKSLKDVEDNRLRLKASIESVRLLANQGAAFRGHDETENSLNAGYFGEVIKSFSRMSVEVERVVLGNAPGNAKYISPSIQKQLLNILGNKVRNKIREEVGDSKYCILVDDAVDTSSKEQMAIILRFVDCHGLVRERFFKIIKSLDFVDAMKFVGHTKAFLQEMREEGWDDLVRNVESFCEKHDIDMPDMNAPYKDGTGRRCQQKDFVTVEHHYHIDVFNALVDFQLSELNRRFSDQTSELLILSSTLDPRDNFRNFKTEDACNLAKKFYPEDFVDNEMFALELECAYYEKDMRSDEKFQNLESISDLCRILVQTRKSEFFPMLYRLICLVLTIPVSTATTERAFSAMNIIKNRLRNRMEDEFLGDCMVLHIEKEYAESIDNESVIKEFEDSGTRRVRFS